MVQRVAALVFSLVASTSWIGLAVRKNCTRAGRRAPLRALLVFPAAFGLMVSLGTPAHAVPDVPEPKGDGISTLGIYALTSEYSGTIGDTEGWQITWRVPTVENTSESPPGAVGQWYYNLETGVYRSGNAWTIFYFGDDNGRTGNNPNCSDIWGSGGWCSGFGSLGPGDEVSFKFERCDAAHNPVVGGSRICTYVDLLDGTGWRFLAEDTPTTVEMYAHDVETFADSGRVEPVISCADPVVMLGQSRKDSNGNWLVMNGSQWTFSDGTPRYQYTNVNLFGWPATWEACSE